MSRSRLGRGLDGLLARGTQSNHTEETCKHPTNSNNNLSSNQSINNHSNNNLSSNQSINNHNNNNLCTNTASTNLCSALSQFKEVDIESIITNPAQARKQFDEEKIQELADSIRSGGLIQPIVVTATNDHKFLIVAGERRFRALKHIGRTHAPVHIIDANEQDSSMLSLIENLQRESLNPIEEAQGLLYLIDHFGMTQEQVAKKLGKARSTISNSIRLLQLDQPIIEAIQLGKISIGHAKVLLGIDSADTRLHVFHAILERDLNVRQTEKLSSMEQASKQSKPVTPKELSEALMKIEKQMAQQLSASVSLHHGPAKGKIVIEYSGEDELMRIVQRIGGL